ncbi:MAG: nucleotidyltransferase domain-containing protein [Candidatus Aminicenantia bacterium]
MIEKLFTSKTRTRILKILLFNPGKEFHLRELSREVKITPIYVKKELANLEKLNLVLSSKKGNLNLFQINKNSPLFSELKSIFLKTEFLTEIIKKSIKKLKIDFAFIYGSFAKGVESKESDIDLFVVGSVDEDGFVRIIQRIEKKVGREVNYILWNKNVFLKRARKHHLLNEIAKNPIIVLVGDEDELRKIIGK